MSKRRRAFVCVYVVDGIYAVNIYSWLKLPEDCLITYIGSLLVSNIVVAPVSEPVESVIYNL